MPKTDPEKLLKECEEALDKAYDVYPFDGCTELSPTGELYITYTCGGPKAEGEVNHVHGKDPLDAAVKYRCQITSRFLSGRFPGHRIFWRCRPEIRELDGIYDVWSRFVVSNESYFLPG